jgi:hypothetical protein
MAYSGTIDPTKPLFNGPAGQGDDELRKLKTDLLERFGTIIENIDADPWTIKKQALESKFGPTYIRHLSFQPRDNTSAISRGIAAISPNAHTNLVVYGQAILPIGALLTGAQVRYTSLAAAAVIGITLYRVYDGGGPDTIATFAPTSGAGVAVTTSAGVVPAVVVREGDTFVYVISLDTTTAPNVNDVMLHWAGLFY